MNRRRRQVAEITLFAISLDNRLSRNLVLKGGSLLAVAYGSSRFTTDLDFTSIAPPPLDPAKELRDLLDPALIRSAAILGYTGFRCRVQSIKMRPKSSTFYDAAYPALQVKIGSSTGTANENKSLSAGAASDVLDLDISYREPLLIIEEVPFVGRVSFQDGNHNTLLVYSTTEIIAEKLRAYLQQTNRRHERSRRQDVYDIAYLIEKFGEKLDKNGILEALKTKSNSRGINPTIEMIDDPDRIALAKRDWHSLEAEIGKVPDFYYCFRLVRDFYISLPW